MRTIPKASGGGRTVLAVMVTALLVALAAVGGAGLVAADHADDNDDVLIHATEDTSDELASVWAEVEANETINESNADDNNVTVSFLVEGYNATDDENTTLHDETVDIEQDTTHFEEYTLADGDADAYDELRLTVEVVEEGHHDRINSSEWGATYDVVGGGGGIGGSGLFSSEIVIGVVVLVAVGAILKSRES